MIRLSELKLALADVPTEHRRAADAPTETRADREPPPHPIEALTRLAAQALGLAAQGHRSLAGVQAQLRRPQGRFAGGVHRGHDAGRSHAEPALLAKFEHNPHIQTTPDMAWHAPGHAPAGWPAKEAERPVVIGLGPCGLFAALALAQMGLKPIVLERGKPVRERTKDTWGLWRHQKLNPESNVQYGEGGAGLFSDGKLYSQIKDPRFLGRKVMNEFVEAGAPKEILYQAHPHIGTFKLVKVVEAMREKIIALGGEIRFQQQVVGFSWRPPSEGQQQLTALRVKHLDTGETSRTAHAARRAGPGPQLARHLCPAARCRRVPGGQTLLGGLSHRAPARRDRPSPLGPPCRPPPAGRGRLQAGAPREKRPRGLQLLHVPGRHRGGGHQRAGPRGHQRHEPVFAQRAQRQRRHGRGHRAGRFPAAVSARHAAVDGRLRRDRLAHATPPRPRPWRPRARSIRWPASSCSASWKPGPTRWAAAPTRRRASWWATSSPGQPSTALADVEPSYKPGVKLGDLAPALPAYAIEAMREALPVFGRKIKGYDMPGAVLTGVETRTSAPLRITRGADLQSLNTRGLYPAGEGAGYAGGILSAGVDGLKVAEALARTCPGLASGTERLNTPLQTDAPALPAVRVWLDKPDAPWRLFKQGAFHENSQPQPSSPRGHGCHHPAGHGRRSGPGRTGACHQQHPGDPASGCATRGLRKRLGARTRPHLRRRRADGRHRRRRHGQCRRRRHRPRSGHGHRHLWRRHSGQPHRRPRPRPGAHRAGMHHAEPPTRTRPWPTTWSTNTPAANTACRWTRSQAAMCR